jgi:hypothetical protein
MSLLMFSETHLEQVVSGEKTQTRRRWDAPRVTPGKSYRAVRSDVSGSMFTKREDAPAYVLIEDVWEEPLGDITEEAAQKEGNYTREEFVAEWERIHGEWTPELPVYVVEFVGYEDDPRTL